jgi:hypothetical protein
MLHEKPNTAEILLLKAYSVIGCAFAARSCEQYDLDFEDIVKTSTTDGHSHYEIKYDRAKTNGPKEGSLVQTITGDLEVKAISEYIECFKFEDRKGRFFRKLLDKNGEITSSKQVIGIHSADKFGQKVAAILGLPDSKDYTGHCWRRTATTFAANAGLTLAQMKTLTGHKSDTVIQGYIDKSDVMKNTVAGAVSIQQKTVEQTFQLSAAQSLASNDHSAKRQRIDDNGSTSSMQNLPNQNISICLTNSTIQGNFSLFNLNPMNNA